MNPDFCFISQQNVSLRTSAHTGVAIRVLRPYGLKQGETDSHTSDIGHWLGMTGTCSFSRFLRVFGLSATPSVADATAPPRGAFDSRTGREENPKGGLRPSVGRFKERGFLRRKGNRNPFLLKWFFGTFLSIQKGTRRRHDKVGALPDVPTAQPYT